MTTTHPRPGHPEENLGEFAEELRLLAEAVLERVEPVLRRTASDGRVEWSSCSWCPVCAAAAIVRGEHHDVVAAIADHGTAIVTVLREALAGVPVDPVIPPDLDPDSPEYHAWHHYSRTATDPGSGDLPFADAYATARGDADTSESDDNGAESGWGESESTEAGHPHRPGANLTAMLARFVVGMQGRAAARNQARHNAFGTDPDAMDGPPGPRPGASGRSAGDPPDPASAGGADDSDAGGNDHLGRGPGAARSPAGSGAARAETPRRKSFGAGAAGGPVGAPGGMPFGPPVAGPADDIGGSIRPGGVSARGPVPGAVGRSAADSTAGYGPGRADSSTAPDAGRDPGPATGRGAAQPSGGRRAKRAKYVPIDVNIKA
ncbi:hypothetical protein [Nocardia terrae]|uniref:hypothetical protein n=1 Tax=Nocardia terrae TaxID=2675851 RepID=UPI001F22D38B|nr:hypothetical protein [Nocardia terrae]